MVATTTYYGLLSGSFRPEDQVCVLRSYIRQRESLIKSASAHVQQMQKALIQMNLHLHKVISDLTGVTGMKIIKAIVAGQGDPQILASFEAKTLESPPTTGKKRRKKTTANHPNKVKSSQTRPVALGLELVPKSGISASVSQK